MNVTIVNGSRFYLDEAGALHAEISSPYHYDFWARYLDVYDHVHLVTRAAASGPMPERTRPVAGPGVEAHVVPDFHGLDDLPVLLGRVLPRLRQQLLDAEALHLQMPSPMAIMGSLLMLGSDRPFAVEIKGDPFGTMAQGTISHPLRPLYQRVFTVMQRYLCANAASSAYVTREAMQRLYPPAPGSFTTHFSNVELPDEAFTSSPRSYPTGGWEQRPLRLLLVGMFKSLVKAPDVLLQALARCGELPGPPLELTFVGDGKFLPQMEELARELGVGDQVHFAGRLPSGASVRKALDEADLYVLPSRQEGLPRSLIEAMARGLPAVATRVGGVSELLPDEVTVPPDDVEALALKIRELSRAPQRLQSLAAANLETARDYHIDLLRARRIAFFEATAEVTGRWLETR